MWQYAEAGQQHVRDRAQVAHLADAVEELVGRHVPQLRQVLASAGTACVPCPVLPDPAGSTAREYIIVLHWESANAWQAASGRPRFFL